MTRQEFDTHMGRLNSQWRNVYGDERRNLLWLCLKDVDADDFMEAVTNCILSCRAAPLLHELSKAVEEAKSRRIQNQMRGGSFSQFFEEAEKANKRSDPDFVRACKKLLHDYWDNKITKVQFIEGCAALDAFASQLNPQGSRGVTKWRGTQIYESGDV